MIIVALYFYSLISFVASFRRELQRFQWNQVQPGPISAAAADVQRSRGVKGQLKIEQKHLHPGRQLKQDFCLGVTLEFFPPPLPDCILFY